MKSKEGASQGHVLEDGASLLPDFHRETKATQLFSKAIDLAITIPECDSRDWPDAVSQLRDQAWKATDEDKEDHSPVERSVSEIRKSLTKIRKYKEFQQAFLNEIMAYKCGPYARNAAEYSHGTRRRHATTEASLRWRSFRAT